MGHHVIISQKNGSARNVKKNKNPPFEITYADIGLVAEIAELMGKLSFTNKLSANPMPHPYHSQFADY